MAFAVPAGSNIFLCTRAFEPRAQFTLTRHCCFNPISTGGGMRDKSFVFVAVVVLCVFIAWTAFGQGQRSAVRQAWEYGSIKDCSSGELNKAGAAGWELVTVVGGTCFMKRPL
jgi:hypothetical protein